MKWAPGECKRGDMIRVRLGSIYHYGIFVSEEEVIQFGYPPTKEFAELNVFIEVCSVDIDTFACGSIVEVPSLDRAERRSRLDPEETVRRARSRLGEEGYNIIHNNCEHFAFECVFGVSRSVQEEKVRAFWKSKLGKDKK